MEEVVAQILAPAKVARHDGSMLSDVLQVLTRLESNGPARRNPYFLAGPRIAPDAPLAGLYLEDPKPAQFDPLAPLHRGTHRVEHGIDRHLSLDFGDVGGFRHSVDDV